MFARTRRFRRNLGQYYSALYAALLERSLRGHRAGRDFSRVVVVAELGRENGIAMGARLQASAFREIGIDVQLVDVTGVLRNPLLRKPHRPGSAYVFHSGAPQAASLIGAMLPHAARAWRVGYWAWELPDPPPDWSGCDALVDEVWTPSTFAKASLDRCFDKPVHAVPHHLPVHPMRPPRPERPFTVLVMADTRSSLSRKNPEGALRAFQRAFGPSSLAQLCLKLSGSPDDCNAFEESMAALLTPHVRVIRGHLDPAQLSTLYDEADVLLSLHRAEGYGIPMREAMSRGLPVIATAWSGNMDFMTGADSCLVPCRLVPVSDPAGVYFGSVWADPDLEAAAGFLRRLATDPQYRTRIGLAAHLSVARSAPVLPAAVPEHSWDQLPETTV